LRLPTFGWLSLFLAAHVAACAGSAVTREDPAQTGESTGVGGAMSAGSGGSKTSGGGGAQVIGAGGAAGSSVGAGGAGGSSMVSSVWHGAKSKPASDAVMQQEYATWKMRNVITCSNGSAGVKRDAGSIVSEGIGYGMLLSVAFADRTLFDALFRYYNDHLDENGLMNWAQGLPNGGCEPPNNNMAHAATDGDLDTTMALIQADRAWPDGGYLDKAKTLAANIAANEVVDCSGRMTLRPGDVWGACIDKNNDKRVNPSYFAPGYYRVFAARFPDQADKWNALIKGTYELLPIVQGKMSGLVPDWTDAEGADLHGGWYGYDACRSPWRIAVDYAWSGDAAAKTFLQSMSTWIDTHSGIPQAAQMLPNGAQGNNSAFIGSFALTGIYDQTKLDGYVSAWLATMVDDTPYYQGTLRLLYLLLAAGKFPSTI
jgi:endo-1,4-beta-D-glucanase Y